MQYPEWIRNSNSADMTPSSDQNFLQTIFVDKSVFSHHYIKLIWAIIIFWPISLLSNWKKMSLGHVKNRIKTLNNLNLDQPTGELGRLKLVEMRFADRFRPIWSVERIVGREQLKLKNWPGKWWNWPTNK